MLRSTSSGTAAPTPAPWYRTASTTRGLPRERTPAFKFANKITVDTHPPSVLSATGLKAVLAGPGRSVAIKYNVDEKAHALVTSATA